MKAPRESVLVAGQRAPGPLSRPCPKCGAPIGHRCRASHRSLNADYTPYRKQPHPERRAPRQEVSPRTGSITAEA